METTDLEINDILPRIREHKERSEVAPGEARAILAMRTKAQADSEKVAAEMSDCPIESELT